MLLIMHLLTEVLKQVSKKKWVNTACRFKCVDGLSHFGVCYSQSPSDSPI